MQPAGQGAQRVADARHPGQQHGLRAVLGQPVEPARFALLGKGDLGAVADPVVDHAAQRVAEGGDTDRRPEHRGIGFDDREHGRLGAERQQGRRHEGDQEDGGEPDAGGGEDFQQPEDGGLDHGAW